MPSKGTTPTQIRIPDDVKAAGEARCAQTGETLSAMVVRLLRAELGLTPPSETSTQRPAAAPRTL